VLVGATAAYATFFNSYKGSKIVFAPKVAGSKAHPAPVGMTEVLKAAAPAGDRAAPLTDIKTKIFGVTAHGNKLPVCTDSMIVNAGAAKGFDKACPKGSLIAQGPVHALLGPSNDPSTGKGTPCNPFLHVYNGGPKTQVFFFTTDATHQCAGLLTGATAPYDGHISYSGGNMIVNVPLPPSISTQVAGQSGLYGSLIGETLVYARSTTVSGKTKHYQTSVACKKGKRAWSIQYTATDYNGGTETQTIKGTDKC
jgi:hypothetical protein